MPEFGKDIGWVALVIMAMISRPTSRLETHVATFQATWPKYPERLFSSVTKSNIEM